MEDPDSGSGGKKPGGPGSTHGVLHGAKVPDHADSEVVLVGFQILHESWMVGDREGDDAGLGLVRFRETSERLVLVNHDAVGHLKGGKRGHGEFRVEISSGEGYHNRSPDVYTKSCNHVVALYSIKSKEEVDFQSLPA